TELLELGALARELRVRFLRSTRIVALARGDAHQQRSVLARLCLVATLSEGVRKLRVPTQGCLACLGEQLVGARTRVGIFGGTSRLLARGARRRDFGVRLFTGIFTSILTGRLFPGGIDCIECLDFERTRLEGRRQGPLLFLEIG